MWGPLVARLSRDRPAFDWRREWTFGAAGTSLSSVLLGVSVVSRKSRLNGVLATPLPKTPRRNKTPRRYGEPRSTPYCNRPDALISPRFECRFAGRWQQANWRTVTLSLRDLRWEVHGGAVPLGSRDLPGEAGRSLPGRAKLFAAGTCDSERRLDAFHSARLGRVGLRGRRTVQSKQILIRKQIAIAKSDVHPNPPWAAPLPLSCRAGSRRLKRALLAVCGLTEDAADECS